ncbi:MAG: hypothetical protein ACR2G9_03035 [Gaiellaceae bacterium]
MISTEEWEALEETLEILQDDETLAALRESEQDVKAGRLFSLAEARRDLGLAWASTNSTGERGLGRAAGDCT